MSEAVIALGSNMGNRIENINAAVRAIAKLPHVKIVKASSVYETDPVGKEDQERFYNAALLINTDISPAMLLGGCLGIEAAMGRVRTEKNGPRIIDLDLILYENFKSESYDMIIGSGERLEDVVIIKFIAVSGEYSYLGRKYEVTDSNITCVAKSNGR